MTDEQKQPVADATGLGEAQPEIAEAAIGELDAPVAVEDMIPEPPSDTVEVAEFAEVAEATVSADSDAATAVIEESAVEVAEAPTEPAPAEVPAEEAVEPLTAADIPALEGCDVEKSWSGDETCEGTEPIAEDQADAEDIEVAEGVVAVADPEADSGLEAAEGEAEVAAAIEAEHAGIAVTPTWPFIVYLVAWAALCIAAGWQLLQIPAGQAIATTEAYRIAVLGGVAMTIAGPLLILAVWLASYFMAGERSKTGMLASSLLKGSVVTFLGVVMWWGTFLIVDQVRFGRFF